MSIDNFVVSKNNKILEAPEHVYKVFIRSYIHIVDDCCSLQDLLLALFTAGKPWC